jgi:sugar phosphate isomerase/epimerase
MSNFSRRTFLGGAALSAAAFRLPAEAMGIPPGTQTYVFRNEFAKDIPGTMKALADIGTRRIELCSPWSYRDFAGFKDYKPADLKKLLDSNNIVAESCHYGMAELKNNLDERVGWAKEIGMKQMILASMPVPRQNATLADWDRACDDLNKAGEQALKSGVQIGFHNHDGEFVKIDDVLIYDHLMQKLDPKAVKMQFQVSVISKGYKAEDYLTKYAGRFISLHLQDWSSAEKKQVPLGKGDVAWPKLFAAAKKAGVKNWYVELESLNIDATKDSYAFLKSIKG